MERYFIISLGCCKNLVDAENMLGMLGSHGYQMTQEPAEAEIIIVNTCAFIDPAKQESIDTILEYAAYKEAGVCRALVVTGCLAQRYQAEILKEMPEVDAVIGIEDAAELDVVLQKLKGGERVLKTDGTDARMDYRDRVVTTPFYTAYLKIAEGCDNRCTYCVIPQIRGPYKSRPMEELLDEARRLAENGVEELIVVAQDTTWYGQDLYQKPMLAKLLRELCKIKELRWIRVHYTYPERLTEELIGAMLENPKIVRYLDIPVQHSEDTVLKKMGRRSSRQELLALFEKLREELPDIVLRTSIIVGFPGETEEDFENLLDFVQAVKFDRLGAFTYSQEEGTPAAAMPQVDDSVKQERYDRLMRLQMEIARQKNSEKIGKTFEVLVEGYDTVSDLHIGRTYGDSIEIDENIYFSADRRYDSGEFVDVTVTDFEPYRLYGEAAEIS